MKNINQHIYIFIFAAIVFSACSTANKAVSDRLVSRSEVSGTWVLSNIDLEGFPAGYSVGDLFNMSDYLDFHNSIWDLKGSGTGSISLTNGIMQPIYWSINKTTGLPSFQFKKLLDGQKAKEVTTGYNVEFGEVSDGILVLKTPVELTNGQLAYIKLSLSKQ